MEKGRFMAIPSYDKFFKPVLDLLADGKIHTSKETIDYSAAVFGLSEEERAAMLPSERQTVLANRVGWARTYLKKAGLLESPARGKYRITAAGTSALADGSRSIDNEYLMTFKSFRDFQQSAGTRTGKQEAHTLSDSESTPQETMEVAYKKITAQLADELRTNIMGQTPAFFERLVMDLLEKMGYGGELMNRGEVTGQTGDEGIDGIIREDALGFEQIYVQAKRWAMEHAVSEPDIQQFAGALMGKGATKGLFITTSRFSKKAREYVEKHMTAKIVLVDGDTLTRLMIRYGLGVSVVHSYEIKRVDSDYFKEALD